MPLDRAGRMHSLTYRVNSLFTFAGTTLAIMCALSSFSDLLHRGAPSVDLKLHSVEHLINNGFNDEARVLMDLNADFTDAFSWNTKQLFVFICVEYSTPKHQFGQISVWDKIIVSPDVAKISIKDVRNKYKLVDQGHHFRDLPFNLTVYWNVMPKVGYLYTRSMTFSGFSFPVAI